MKLRVTISFFIALFSYHISCAQKMIAHYQFNNNVLDISGNKNDGVIMGGVAATADRFGNPCGAYQFNGIDGYIEVPNSISLQSPSQTFSATCWFKIQNVPKNNGLNWLTLLCKGDQSSESPTNPQYRVQTFQSASQSTISINTDFTEYDNDYFRHLFELGKWNFYALVYDGQAVRCYLNTMKIWEFTYNLPLHRNNDPLHIGRDAPGALEFFCGALDDLRIYNTPLSEKEITKLYNEVSTIVNKDEFTLTCTSNIIAYTEQNQCYSIVNYPDPSLIMNCGTASLTQTAGFASGSQFPIGVSIVSYSAESSTGFKKSCSFKITVIDQEPPIIICKSDTVIFVPDPGPDKALYNYDPPYSFDECSPTTIKLMKGLPSGSAFPIGTTQLLFHATDKANNSAECSVQVTVKKSPKVPKKEGVEIKKETPNTKNDTIKCPPDITKNNDSHKCGAIINYSINQGKEEIKLISGQESGTFFPVGTTINKYAIGKTNKECTFQVMVVDNERPELICPNDIIIYTSAGAKTTKVDYAAPIAHDNCGIDSILQIGGRKSGDFFPIGTTQNIFKATDFFGNYASCSFNIIIVDTASIKTNDPLTELEYKPNLIPDSIKYIKQPFEFKTCMITIISR